ncbi:rhodopsin [Penaeus vannamei]|uniref:Rhodopsin n=1 Tax=Penaeus vannamei TaxID=6689 RepID=A0A423SY30_PENVA|nr:rhodopsin [Penaeus vannamei]
MSWNNPVQDSVLPSTNPYGNYTVVDTVPQSMLHMIHSHWYQFPPMNPLWYGLLGFWMVVMGTLSVAGNFVVIWVFMKYQESPNTRQPACRQLGHLRLLHDAYHDSPSSGQRLLGTHGFSVHSSVRSMLSWILLRCVSIWSMSSSLADRYNVIVKGWLCCCLLTPHIIMVECWRTLVVLFTLPGAFLPFPSMEPICT